MGDVNNPKNECLAEDVAAYLDDELEGRARELFEEHHRSCKECAAELLRQRQLLCDLDVALNDINSLVLPRDFARVVAAHAESDMRGMRNPRERRRALHVSLVLAALSFALLGAASAEAVWAPARSIVRAAQSFSHFLWEATYQASSGLAVIFKMLTRSFVFESRLLGLSILLLFLIALALLPRLISRYHRTQIVE
ncbi:MAG: zf-HC2 domain-containing protein [Pyrinomonadaceae bacterium]